MLGHKIYSASLCIDIMHRFSNFNVPILYASWKKSNINANINYQTLWKLVG